NIDRLGRLIADLLDISRIESGKIELHKQDTDLTSAIKDVIGFFECSARQKKINLINLCQDTLPSIYADTDRIIQVLTNLVGNAIKFTPISGEISIAANLSDETIKISIMDTGAGIPKLDLGKVFDKFYQIAGSDKTVQKEGTGLGLPICKGIIEKHGGRIWVESELGKGSKFIFQLPVKRRFGNG
ncbi:MAG: cell wall metabolism sensor histidine kinase WalK, partial [Candidatus Omnitrophica bacterium]|nr:cell wall metabolism sensor histidine kinase WalK [Candidatus Omnitrophota bacterium]